MHWKLKSIRSVDFIDFKSEAWASKVKFSWNIVNEFSQKSFHKKSPS